MHDASAQSYTVKKNICIYVAGAPLPWVTGTMDDKIGVLGILEAVEILLRQGFKPRRTLYIAFGHDEETDGDQGAAKIALLLKQRGIRLDFVLDEGGAITDGEFDLVCVRNVLVLYF